MSDEGWEERMAARAAVRRRYVDPFKEWRQPTDPEDILPQILAARCLGISYGDPGPRLPENVCRECWGDRHVWLGNTWGTKHRGGGLSYCQHECHADEVWLAGAPDVRERTEQP